MYMHVCMYVLYIFILYICMHYTYLYPTDTGQVIINCKEKKCEHAVLLHTASYTVSKWNYSFVSLYSQLI